jgi:hypothetical protein
MYLIFPVIFYLQTTINLYRSGSVSGYRPDVDKDNCLYRIIDYLFSVQFSQLLLSVVIFASRNHVTSNHT